MKVLSLLLLFFLVPFISESESENIKDGTGALKNITTGDRNIAHGTEALRDQKTGKGSLALGFRAAMRGTDRDYGIYLGPYAGYRDSTDNRLYITNRPYSASNSNFKGIWGDLTNGYFGINGESTVDFTVNGAATITGDLLFTKVTFTDSVSIRMSNTSDPSDSILIFHLPSGVPTITGVAPDNTTSAITWIDGDELLLSDADVKITNNRWLRAIDNAGSGSVNMFKVNTSDEIDVGAQLNVGPLTAAEDTGALTFMDMSVSASPAAGTEESYTFKIDTTNILTIYAEADNSGGIQNKAIKVFGGQIWDGYSHVGSSRNTTGEDYIIGVSSDDGAITITLDTDTVTAGRVIHIKDEDGNASVNTITIDTEGAETIDEANSVTIESNFGSLSFYSNGTNWFIK